MDLPGDLDSLTVEVNYAAIGAHVLLDKVIRVPLSNITRAEDAQTLAEVPLPAHLKAPIVLGFAKVYGMREGVPVQVALPAQRIIVSPPPSVWNQRQADVTLDIDLNSSIRVGAHGLLFHPVVGALLVRVPTPSLGTEPTTTARPTHERFEAPPQSVLPKPKDPVPSLLPPAPGRSLKDNVGALPEPREQRPLQDEPEDPESSLPREAHEAPAAKDQPAPAIRSGLQFTPRFPGHEMRGVDRSPWLSWNTTREDLRLAHDVWLDGKRVCANTTARSCPIYSLQPGRQYTWRVASHGPGGRVDSPTWTFWVRDLAPTPPRALAPEDGAQNVAVWSNLSWDAKDPDGLPLAFTVWLAPAAEPPAVVCRTKMFQCQPGLLRTSTTYQWRVEASDGTHATSSETWMFVTEEIDSSRPCELGASCPKAAVRMPKVSS